MSVWDPRRRELICFVQQRNPTPAITWSFRSTDSPQWREMATASEGPVISFGVAAVHDPLADRVIVLVPDLGGGDVQVWALHLGSPAKWTRLQVEGNPPLSRASPAMAFDDAAHQIVLFGGWRTTFPPPGEWRELQDTWVLELDPIPAWREVEIDGVKPPPRLSGVLAPGENESQFLLLGGRGAGFPQRDAWLLNMGPTPGWAQITAVDESPLDQDIHGASFDRTMRGFVVLGSDPVAETVQTTLLSLEPSPHWQPLGTEGAPRARPGAVAHYDQKQRQAILPGGRRQYVESLDEVWALSLGASRTWENWTPSVQRPSRRQFHAATYVSSTRSVAVLGGIGGGLTGSLAVPEADVWALSLRNELTWKLMGFPESPGPGRRYYHTLVYDEVRNQLMAFGGIGRETDSCSPCTDSWSVPFKEGGVWRDMETSGEPPTLRSPDAAFYDASRDRMLVVGGGDVWALSIEPNPTWSKIDPVNEPPSIAGDQVAAFDTERNRLILYGGLEGESRTRSTKTWVLTLGDSPRWSQLETLGETPLYLATGAMYDRLRDRVLVLAMGPGDSWLRLEVWELPLDEPNVWRRLEATGAVPSAMLYMPLVYDPHGDRIVLFGGGTYAGAGVGFPSTDYLQFLELGDPVHGVELLLRPGTSRGRVVPWSQRRVSVSILGSEAFDARTVDEESVTFAGAAALEHPGVGPGRSELRDVNGDGYLDLQLSFRAADMDVSGLEPIVRLQGRTLDGKRIEGETHLEFARGRRAPRMAAAPSSLALSVSPNPVQHSIQARVQLAGSETARLELLDIAGRRIHIAELRGAAGAIVSHVIPLQKQLPGGIYWLRLSQAGTQQLTKVVVLR